MNKIYIVEFSNGEYGDYRTYIAGVSTTREGADVIKNKFRDLLDEYYVRLNEYIEKFQNELKDDKRIEFQYDNYKLSSYNPKSLRIREFETEKFLIELNKN